MDRVAQDRVSGGVVVDDEDAVAAVVRDRVPFACVRASDEVVRRKPVDENAIVRIAQRSGTIGRNSDVVSGNGVSGCRGIGEVDSVLVVA